MMVPKRYKEEKAKETPEMEAIAKAMPALYGEKAWTPAQKEAWNLQAKDYNRLAVAVGMAPGYHKVIL